MKLRGIATVCCFPFKSRPCSAWFDSQSVTDERGNEHKFYYKMAQKPCSKRLREVIYTCLKTETLARVTGPLAPKSISPHSRESEEQEIRQCFRLLVGEYKVRGQ